MQSSEPSNWTRQDFTKFYSEVWQCPVLPIGADKKPRVKSWTQYQTTMPTEKELEGCQKSWGITFILKHNLFALDFDKPEAYELFKDRLPDGACIAKTPHGYHVVLRSSNTTETIKGGNEQLIQCLERISPLLLEVENGKKKAKIDILGDNSLLHSPDSPGYKWLELHQEPATVNFVQFLSDLFGYTHRISDFKKTTGQGGGVWINIYCPWCEFDGKKHDSESCSVDIAGGGFNCHGSCGRKGKLTELVEQCQNVGYPVRDEIMEAYQRLINLGTKPSQPKFAVPTDEQFIFRGDEPIKVEQMSEAVVLGVMWKGDIVENYGQAGTGKSSYQTAAAGDFIAGRPLYGDWPIPHAYKVLYLDLENPAGETRKAIQAAVDSDAGALKRVTIAEMIGLGFDITSDKWYTWLDKLISDNHFDVVIGDNLGKMTGRNIIDDNEMKTVVNQYLRPLVRKHNILFILVHHTGWERYDAQGKELPSHGKGGSSLFEDVNACFEIRRQSKYVTRLTVKKVRSRQATIAVGDEFVHYYDRETMRILPVAWKEIFDKVAFLVDKLGLGVAADKLNTTKVNLSRYRHGFRQPSDEMTAMIDKLTKEEGYIHRLIT